MPEVTMPTLEMYHTRKFFSRKATLGELTYGAEQDGISILKHVCWTLEDVDRGDDMTFKVKGETAIPAGRREVMITHSPAFKCMMPLVIGVDGFIGIRMHWGIRVTHTEWCILLGHAYDITKWELDRSRAAYDTVFSLIQQAELKGQKVYLTTKREEEAYAVHQKLFGTRLQGR